MIVRGAYTDTRYAICHRHYDMDRDQRGAPDVALGPVQDARDHGCQWCARETERRLRPGGPHPDQPPRVDSPGARPRPWSKTC